MKITLANKEAVWPKLYPTVERKDPTVSDKGWDRVGDFTLREKVDLMPQAGLQEKLCACDSNLVFLAGAASMGKSQPVDAMILTPNGFVKNGVLKVGETISGSDGKAQKILSIFKQGIRPVYRVTFSDNSVTECDEEHLWRVSTCMPNSKTTKTHYRYGDFETLPLKEIMKLFKKGYSIKIPMCGPIEFYNNKPLPISPYTLGVYLADGYSPARGCPWITTDDTPVVEEIRKDGYTINKLPSHKRDYLLSGKDINSHLKELGLKGKHSYDKFIPDIYKYASLDERYALLQGLFDSDGCVSTANRIIYETTSKALFDDITWLIRSVGGMSTCSTGKRAYTYNGEKKIGRQSYRMEAYVPNMTDLFRLERKRSRIVNTANRRWKRRVKSIDYVGKKECQCLLVSNEDHLYVTNDFIVTHNTYSMLLKVLRGVDKQGFSARFISVRLQDSKKGSSIFRDAVEVLGNFAGCQYNSSDYPTFAWPQWNSYLQLIHSNFNVENPAEWEEFKDMAKKSQSSYIAIDEATEMRSFRMFSYWFSRNRDSSGMKPQMVLSFNPEYEHWTTKMLKDAGYLGDDWYAKPEMVGKTRYFYMAGDGPEGIIWGDTPEEVAEAAHIVITEKEREAGITIHQIVKSFTFFTGEAGDNKKLIAATGGESIGNLHAVGATQRGILHGAYFGPCENEETTVSRQMIQNMFSAPQDDDDTMYGTLDVSMGNKDSDNCPFFVWRGHTFIAIVFIRTDPKTLVDEINRVLSLYNIPIENFAFDATGVGYYLTAFTKGMGVTGNRRTIQEYDDAGNPVLMEQYFNLRSQLMGKMKVLLEKGEISCSIDPNTSIPYGKEGHRRQLIDVFYDEINVFRTTTRLKKIYYRNKDEYKAKFHSSPDLMDSFNLRAIFDLDGREKKKAPVIVDDDAYIGIYNTYGRTAQVWS